MEEKKLSVHETEVTLAAPEEPAKKVGLMRGARDFIENTFNSLKGKDLGQSLGWATCAELRAAQTGWRRVKHKDKTRAW